MSRLRFAKAMGALPTNPYNAWSYINHEEKFVLFGAWSDGEENDRQLIYSRKWRVNAKGRKPASYQPSLRHLEHVIEEGYELRTFRQFRKPDDGTGIPKIHHFEETCESRFLSIVGDDFFAVKKLRDEAATEYIEPASYEEGRQLSVTQTHYERSPQAREACLRYYGARCQVCEFDFEEEFGALGAGFIHVHHLVPVSSRKTTYKVHPIEDLRPVCPNCHAMIHKRRKPYTIEEMKNIRSRKLQP